MAAEVAPLDALGSAVTIIDAISALFEAHGPRNAAPGLKAMRGIAVEGLENPEQVAAAAQETRRVWGTMGRGFSDVVIQADEDSERRRLNEEFEQLKIDLASALKAASVGRSGTSTDN